MLNIPKEAGVIVIACRQTAGRGKQRYSNLHHIEPTGR
jgi:biotin-(acetyl-CoA carboxylase) ligase